MRSTLTIAAVLVSSLVVSATSPAFAAGKASQKTKVTQVAKADPLPPLPTPAVSAAPAPALPAPEAAPAAPVTSNVAVPVEADKASTTQFRQTGFVMSFGTGAAYLGGQIADGIDLSGGLVTFSFRLGAFLSPTVGLTTGVEGGYGALAKGCAHECSNAYAIRIPILLEYATSRRRGFHFEGGVTLVNQFGASTDTAKNPDAPPETIGMSSPVSYSFGVGWRFAPAIQERVSGTSFDLRLGFDIGQFTKVDYHSTRGSVKGDIDRESQAPHFMAGLQGAYHFWF